LLQKESLTESVDTTTYPETLNLDWLTSLIKSLTLQESLRTSREISKLDMTTLPMPPTEPLINTMMELLILSTLDSSSKSMDTMPVRENYWLSSEELILMEMLSYLMKNSLSS
jgi:hypothetical protein